MLTRLAKKRRIFCHTDQTLGVKIWAQKAMLHGICSFLLSNELLQLDCVCRFFKQSVDQYLFQNVTFNEDTLQKKCGKNPHLFNQIQKLSIQNISLYEKKYGKYGNLLFPTNLKSLHFAENQSTLNLCKLPPNLQSLTVRNETSLIFVPNCPYLRKLHILTPCLRKDHIVHLSCFLNLQVLNVNINNEEEKPFLNSFSFLMQLRKLYVTNHALDCISELPPNLEVLCIQYFKFKEGYVLPRSLKKMYLYEKNYVVALDEYVLIPSSVRVLQHATSISLFESADKMNSLQMFISEVEELQTLTRFSNLRTLSLNFFYDVKLSVPIIFFSHLRRLSLINFQMMRSFTTTEFPETLEYLHWAPDMHPELHNFSLTVESNSNLRYLAMNSTANVKIYCEKLKFVLLLAETYSYWWTGLEVRTKETVLAVIVRKLSPRPLLLPCFDPISLSTIETFRSHIPFPADFFSKVVFSGQFQTSPQLCIISILNKKQKEYVLNYWYRLMSICRIRV